MEVLTGSLEAYLQGSLLMAFFASFAGGVLTSFTPCIYPMLPVTAAVIGEKNIGGTKRRGFLLSLIYVAGIAVTYSALGVFAASTGRMFGQISSSPVAYIIVANVMIFLALCMMDIFTISFDIVKGSPKTKGIPGIFITGMITGLAAGPCTAPVLGVLLAYVATTGNLFTGGALLFVFAIGMGVLVMMAGTFSGILATLPKAGQWSVRIKTFIGLVLLCIGEYFLIKAGQVMF